MAEQNSIAVSVVIPALALEDEFVAMLHRLAAQECAFGFEIVVVLNHAERPVDAVLPAGCRVLFCAMPGSYAARNTGIAAARGHLLAFTDSDTEPAPNWLSEGYAAAEIFDFNALIAGRISTYRRRKTVAGVYDMLFYLRQEAAVLAGRAMTANLFVPLPVMTAVGGFDASLFSSGDSDLCRRAREAGYQLAYCGQVEVRHPARDTLWEVVQKERRTSGGLVAYSARGQKTSLRLHALAEWRFFRGRIHRLRKLNHPDTPVIRLHLMNVLLWGVRLTERCCVVLGKKPRRF